METFYNNNEHVETKIKTQCFYNHDKKYFDTNLTYRFSMWKNIYADKKYSQEDLNKQIHIHSAHGFEVNIVKMSVLPKNDL